MNTSKSPDGGDSTYGKFVQHFGRQTPEEVTKWEVFSFIKKTTSYGIEKYIYSTYSPLSSTHLYFVILNSLTRKIFLVVLKIGNMKSKRLISTPT
jgi:hypothetical protein